MCNCSADREPVEISLVQLVGKGGGQPMEKRSKRAPKPQLVPNAEANPVRSREALRLIELADAALADFETLVTVGLFKVTITDEERARDLATHAFNLAETAKATPDTGLELRYAFESLITSKYEDLPSFFAQPNRKKKHYMGVLKRFKDDIQIVKDTCALDLAAVSELEQQELLREVVNELP